MSSNFEAESAMKSAPQFPAELGRPLFVKWLFTEDDLLLINRTVDPKFDNRMLARAMASCLHRFAFDFSLRGAAEPGINERQHAIRFYEKLVGQIRRLSKTLDLPADVTKMFNLSIASQKPGFPLASENGLLWMLQAYKDIFPGDSIRVDSAPFWQIPEKNWWERPQWIRGTIANVPAMLSILLVLAEQGKRELTSETGSNAERIFLRSLFYWLTRFHCEAFHRPPQLRDNNRAPRGSGTLWVHKILLHAAKQIDGSLVKGSAETEKAKQLVKRAALLKSEAIVRRLHGKRTEVSTSNGSILSIEMEASLIG
jgi:hypothetical protein